LYETRDRLIRHDTVRTRILATQLMLLLDSPAKHHFERRRGQQHQEIDPFEQPLVVERQHPVDIAPPAAVCVFVCFQGIHGRGERIGRLRPRTDTPALEENDLHGCSDPFPPGFRLPVVTRLVKARQLHVPVRGKRVESAKP
jgi:hypothetical protein